MPLNAADNWLHLVLGAGMIALGLLLSGRVIDVNTPFNRNTR